MDIKRNNENNEFSRKLEVWVRRPFERLNYPTNFESMAKACAASGYDESAFGYTRSVVDRTGSFSSKVSSGASTPSNSPLIRRKTESDSKKSPGFFSRDRQLR